LRFAQVRRILDVIRGRDYQQAVMMLEFLPHRAAKIVRARAIGAQSPIPDCRVPCSRAAADAHACAAQVQDAILSCASNAKDTHGMKKSKLFISETYADQARATAANSRQNCAGLFSKAAADAWVLRRAGAVPAAVPAARAGARVPHPQAHLLHPRQDEEPRDQHAHQGAHQDRHPLSARARWGARGGCESRAARCCTAAAPPGAPLDLMLLFL
jgi:hypothetical protein